MRNYVLKRLVALVPTLFGITLIAFIIINLAPGSPVEQKLQQMRFGGAANASMGGGGMSFSTGRNGQAVNQSVIDALNQQYGFDRPVLFRYGIWLRNLARLDFGRSFTYEEPVRDVIVRKLSVSLQFGVMSFLLTYLICIPLGAMKADRHGSRFDSGTSVLLLLAYSTPPFMLAILLIVIFGGGSFLNWFPIAGMVSDNYEDLATGAKVWDRIHHVILPLGCYVLGEFTTVTVLMKNSLLEEIGKDYVRTARAKGLPERRITYKHALRNALIPVVTGFRGFLTVFFALSIFLEKIFGLDGMGLLGYNAVLQRDYNVIMGLLVTQSFLFLLANLMGDLVYVLIDPRLQFAGGG